ELNGSYETVEKEIRWTEVQQGRKQDDSERDAQKEAWHAKVGQGRKGWHSQKPEAGDCDRPFRSSQKRRAGSPQEGYLGGSNLSWRIGSASRGIARKLTRLVTTNPKPSDFRVEPAPKCSLREICRDASEGTWRRAGNVLR